VPRPAAPADALIAVDQVETLATGFVDSVHDLVVRQGCPPDAAVDVVAASLLEVVDRAVDEVVIAAPRHSDDAVGSWFAAAASRAAAVPHAPDGDPTTDRIGRGLAALDPRERTLVLARDRYGLSPRAAGAVVGTDPDDAERAIAAARLRFYRAVTGRAVTDRAEHRPSRLADTATLGRYVEGDVPAADRLAVRRHLSGCADCDDVVSAQEYVRRLVGGLPVTPLDDGTRSAAIDPALERAAAALPASADLIAFADPSASDERDGSSLAALAVTLIVLAAVVGLLAGALAAH
jgi:hypothetical protein